MRKKVAIIGAGKFAYSLTSALIHSGHRIESIISRNLSSAQKLARRFSIKNSSNSLDKIPGGVKIFFITTPDSEIKNVSIQLSKLRTSFNDCVAIHFSGTENIKSLRSLGKKDCATGSLHLMQTFPNKRIMNLKGIHAAIETNNVTAYKFLTKLAQDLKLNPFRIDSEHKTQYHLAGIFASNFLAGNLFSSERLLAKPGISKKDAFNILNSTIYSTLKNIKDYGSAAALSGPVDRGDIETIRKHILEIKKLKKEKRGNEITSLMLKNYLYQSILLLDLVKEKIGELTENHLRLRKLLLEEISKTK